MEQTHSSHFPLTGLFTVSNAKRLGVKNNTEIMEIILLGNEQTKESIAERVVESTANLKVIELSDRKSKMALLRQLKLDSPTSDDLHGHENSLTNNTRGVKKNIETYTLPPGTILKRQDSKTEFQYKIENQQIPPKEMAETTSAVNDTTSGAPMENSKRVQRPIRNKKTVEVRRNPTRVSKKNLDEDFVNPRQRLLSAKRKESFTNTEPAKRAKLSSTPYMNTRSVTRKLYTVGATYHAPTIQDAMEWKEWPVHGMHERPFFHPRFGLGVECIGRFFKSLDGRSFREIHQESEVEVISVDPRDQIADSLDLKKPNRRKIKKLNIHVNESISGKENKSFQTCMHTSLHSVFAYCAQVSDPGYHTTIQNKVENLKIKSCEKENNQELQEGSDSKNEIETGSRVDKKTPIKVQTQSGETEVLSFKRSNSKVSNLVSRLEPKKCLITPRNSANLTMNLQTSHSQLQNVIRGSSRNALIVIKPQEPKRENPIAQVENQKPSILTNDQLFKPTARELNFELGKLDDPAISDETLMEMSSIYEKLVAIEEVNPNSEHFSKSLLVKKVDSELENCTTQNEIQDNNPNKNQTSEIAKILSEYIQSINKVPETENCVLQSGVNTMNISKSAACCNDQKKWDEKSKMSESRGLPKSRVSASNKNHIVETKDIVRNKIEVKKELDLSTLKSKEERKNKESEQSIDVECLQNLLENTAILYCAATGVRQENLANYIDNLDVEQSVGWLKDNDW